MCAGQLAPGRDQLAARQRGEREPSERRGRVGAVGVPRHLLPTFQLPVQLRRVGADVSRQRGAGAGLRRRRRHRRRAVAPQGRQEEDAERGERAEDREAARRVRESTVRGEFRGRRQRAAGQLGQHGGRRAGGGQRRAAEEEREEDEWPDERGQRRADGLPAAAALEGAVARPQRSRQQHHEEAVGLPVELDRPQLPGERVERDDRALRHAPEHQRHGGESAAVGARGPEDGRHREGARHRQVAVSRPTRPVSTPSRPVSPLTWPIL